MNNIYSVIGGRKMARAIGKQGTVFVISFIISLLSIIGTAGSVVSGEVSEKYQVLGKEFWTETVDNEPGNFWVHWGEEKLKWEPKPWQCPELTKAGPIYYARWNKQLGEKGYFPYKINLEDRGKLSAKDFWDYFYVNNPLPMVADENGVYHQDEYFGVLRSPGDEKVYETGGFEFERGYRKSIEFPANEPLWKYVFIQNHPENSSGLGLLQIVYSGEKVDDNFLYLPSVRKVRRLAAASRQDFVARTVFRNEDNALCKPIHNYTWIGQELMKNPGEEMPGYGVGGRHPDPKFQGGDHRVFDGIGEPCQVMEITPFRDDWWFGKIIKRVGIFSGAFWIENAYDQKGREVRNLNARFGPYYQPGQGRDIPGSVPLPHWDAYVGLDRLTGYVMNLYPKAGTITYNVKDVPPDRIFVERTLLKEVKSINFYK